ncbi:MAG: c-type cytochrome [Gammaproteobacteria bacterium]|nr:c-type cytochrome [Gammaproteobacteria bacterium]
MRTLSTLLLLAAASAAAAAQAESPSRGEFLAGACNACHGAEGRGSPPLPPLQGRDDLRQQLQAWKGSDEATDGVRGTAHLMIRFARGLSDADIDALATFYARQEAP